jgi:hypothetical protein
MKESTAERVVKLRFSDAAQRDLRIAAAVDNLSMAEFARRAVEEAVRRKLDQFKRETDSVPKPGPARRGKATS